LKMSKLSLAIALAFFLAFIFLYDIALASEESKAQLVLFCAVLFFAASITSAVGDSVPSAAHRVPAYFATLLLACLILYSLPIPVSMLEILPRTTVSNLSCTNGTLFGPNAKITISAVNLDLTVLGWNGSQFNLITELTARGFTERSAQRVLDRCGYQVDTYGGDLRITFSGPQRLQQRMLVRQTLLIPRSLTPVLSLTATNGSVNLSGLSFSEIKAWMAGGDLQGRSMEAELCDISIDRGGIRMETASRELDLRTISGDITLFSFRPDLNLSAESINGRIEAHLNYSAEIGYLVEANTIGGAISVNLTGLVFTKQKSGFVVARSKDLENSALKTIIRARTTTGNVTIAQI
jgi:hypothetical protein